MVFLSSEQLNLIWSGSLVGYWILIAGFRIPMPRIADSRSKKFLYSGIRIPLHGAKHPINLAGLFHFCSFVTASGWESTQGGETVICPFHVLNNRSYDRLPALSFRFHFSPCFHIIFRIAMKNIIQILLRPPPVSDTVHWFFVFSEKLGHKLSSQSSMPARKGDAIYLTQRHFKVECIERKAFFGTFQKFHKKRTTLRGNINGTK